MPEPMTPPTTIMMVVKRPREGRRPGGGAVDLGVSMAVVMPKTPNSKSPKSSKSQAPSSREIPSSKSQKCNSRRRQNHNPLPEWHQHGKRKRTAALQDAVATERMPLFQRGLGVRLSSAALMSTLAGLLEAWVLELLWSLGFGAWSF